MAILLSLETSTSSCSVALHEDGEVLGELALHIPQSASSALAVMVHDLMKVCGVSAESLAGIAVAAGPGSYTGLRIGVATAKGLCVALQRPLIGVNTLELLAAEAVASPFFQERSDKNNVILCPMLDARRMEVYCGLYDANLNVLEQTAARVVDSQSFADWLERGRIVFFGNGADKCRPVISHPNASFVAGITPRAARLGILAFRRFEAGSFEDSASFEPLYLKDFVIKKRKEHV